MRKFYIACLMLAVIMLPFFTASAASQVDEVRWVTRNDAAISYVRVVMDMTDPVQADASIDKIGTTTTITLKNTTMKSAPKRLVMDKKIAESAVFAQAGKNIIVTIKTPNPLDESDVQVFQVKKDTANNKPPRMVVDIKQKNVTPRSRYYGMPEPTGNYKVDGGIKGKVIVIDPGHGGSDTGAIAANGLQEKTVTLAISNYLKETLEAKGAKVIMTRTKDVDVYAPNASGPDELQARVNVANYNNADLLVSVHINAFTNPSVGGISAYYHTKTSYDKKIADSINTYTVNVPGFGGDRGINDSNLYVVTHTTMPATLLELGFLSNPAEATLLAQPAVQKNFAQQITQGIEKYFQG